MARKITGKVASDAQDKTIVVVATTSKTHAIYGKKFKVSKRFQAHDEKNEAKKGDIVEIVETRPISRTKTFKLSQVLERGHETVEVKKSAVEEEIDAKLAEKAAKRETDRQAEQPDRHSGLDPESSQKQSHGSRIKSGMTRGDE
jgi:small subunit ribosomal protein S17